MNKQSNKQNVDNESLEDMINLLQEYEKMCLQKQDFSSADEAKTKIISSELKNNEDKQNMELVSKKAEQQVKTFQQHWEDQLQQLIDTLKQIEKSLTDQHQQQLQEFQTKIYSEKCPQIKFSSQALEMRKHLRSLIRVKNYKEAEIVKNALESKQKQQQTKWQQKIEEKKKIRIQQLKRKQQNQLKALRVRLEATFNEKLKQRDHKFEILLKKNRKRRIESGKVSRERLRAKTNLLNESKTFSVSKY